VAVTQARGIADQAARDTLSGQTSEALPHGIGLRLDVTGTGLRLGAGRRDLEGSAVR
jgi:hypothetical protein